MRDNEYSRSDGEFFPNGQEISGSGHEWNALPREWNGVPTEADCSGWEYNQDSVPVRRERKKRRRLQPSMLAAAAAVTAVVTLTPVEGTVSAPTGHPRSLIPFQLQKHPSLC